MATIHDSIQIDAPVGRVYSMWTRFEEFPRIMHGFREVRRVDDRHVHWRAAIWGKDVEWDSEITREEPGRLIEWRSTNGPDNGGYVEFTPLAEDQTRVTVHIEYEPRGVVQKVGAVLGVARSRVHHDLEHLKDFLESSESDRY